MRKLGNIMSAKSLEDAWWLCCDKQLHPQVLCSTEIQDYLIAHEIPQAAVLHVTEAGAKVENWIPVRPLESEAEGMGQAIAGGSADLGKAAPPADLNAAQRIIDDLSARVEELEKQMELINKPLSDAWSIIRERESFLNESEERLLMKMHEHERAEAELDQYREDINEFPNFKVVGSD